MVKFSLYSVPFLMMLSGCATIRDSTSQVVLVNSRPAGATLYQEGVDRGPTPTFVKVSRRGTPRLDLQTDGARRPLRLHKRYRWSASFWPNLIWTIGAPVAWAIDMLTGAAFEYDPVDVPELRLAASDRARPLRPRGVAAIAPPLSNEPALSDEGGEALERKIAADGGRVRRYRDTLPAFQKAGYDFDGAPPDSTPVPAQTFTRWVVGGGYGPEFGLQSGKHYLYFDLLPILVWSQIASNQQTWSNTNLQFGSELGYLYYVSKHWSVRVFTRSQNEDEGIWRSALKDHLNPSDRTSASITNSVSGFSVGYRFEPIFGQARRN